jgi:hypothetical protein
MAGNPNEEKLRYYFLLCRRANEREGEVSNNTLQYALG